MKNTSKYLTPLAIAILVFGFAGQSLADSTEVLPKGRSMVNLGYLVTGVDREFDNSGSDRELGYYFNRVDITSLAQPYFNAILGLPAATPSVTRAETFLDASLDVEALTFSYQYGVTDNLTLAVGFPYFLIARTDVDFKTLLWPNTALGLPAGPLDLTEEAQAVLKSEFGYEPIETWHGDPGIGDLIVGGKYRFLDNPNIKSAAGGWVSFPTGQPDDERELTDIAYGSGGYDTGIYAMVDLVPVEPVVINFTGRYVVTWPYERAIYILDKSNPDFYKAELPTLRVSGDYDRGDYYELESELQLNVYKGVNLYGGYVYMQSESARIDDDVVPKSIHLERKVFTGVSLSTVEYYLENQAAVPMMINLYYEPMQTGRNAEKTETWIVTMGVIF